MNIRPPTLTESYRIVQLMDRSLHGVDTAYDHLTRSGWRRALARHMTLPHYFHWLNEGWMLEIKGEIAGWLYLLHHKRSTHVNDLGVAPAYRRQGHGQRLLTWAEQRAKAKGKTMLTLAVTIHNEPAVALYERCGFQALHPQLWIGSREALPPSRLTLPASPLLPAQRALLFREAWARALTSDGHDPLPLLADQVQHWQSGWGKAWEFWQEGQRIGYADFSAGLLRLYPTYPDEPALLAAMGAALAPLLPPGPLTLDLGSMCADQHAAPLLEAQGWQPTLRERMLMIRSHL